MLREVYITKDGEIIYYRNFGKGLDKDGFKEAYKQIKGEAFKLATERTQYHDFFKFRIAYLSVPDVSIIFFFVSDLSDKFENVKKELIRCRKEFMDLFGSILDEKLDEDTFEIFDPTIELIHKNLRPKISLVGFSGVGKTTITRLITAEDIPTEHVPTITGDIGTIKIGKLHFHLWDFAGQEQFSFLWNNFIKGSDAVLLITDSSLENCEKSKFFIELIKKEAPYAHMAAIGNKQDLPDAMPILDIERHLSCKVYSMIAIDVNNRDKMITIIADILEMSGEVSPLLAPLMERDRVLKDAEKALESGNFEEAVKLFSHLSDLSIELGDDRVSQDFHEKAQKIKAILKQSAPTQSKPAAPSITPAPPAPSNPPAPSAPSNPPAPSAPSNPPIETSQTIEGTVSSDGDDKLGALINKLKDKGASATTSEQVPTKNIASLQTPSVPNAGATPPPAPKPETLESKATQSDSQLSESKSIITDLKIKMANINKTMLDLEMDNITGDLSDEDFKTKSARLEAVKNKIQKQIGEMENL